MPELPENDPVVSKSLGRLYLVAALLLVATLAWALYDEFFGLRPWKGYEREFARRYSIVLARRKAAQEKVEKEIQASAEYLAIKQKVDELSSSIQSQQQKINDQAALVQKRLDAITNVFTDARANAMAQIYNVEHASSTKGKDRLGRRLATFEQGPFYVAAPSLEDGHVKREKFTYQQLEEAFKNLQARKAQLGVEQAELLRPLSALTSKLNAYTQDHLNGLSSEQLDGLLRKTQDPDIEIRQINKPDAGIVDRCESCHLGVREPAALTRADMAPPRGKLDRMSAAFTSHPDAELLKVHNPEKFGCTPCHNGNGMQVDSVRYGHGEYEHWLGPLYHRAYFQAGCQQCHARDMFVDHAPVLTRGKELFSWRGCVGCHRFEGYDMEPEELVSLQQSIHQLESQRGELTREIDRDNKEFNDPSTSEERARYLKARLEELPVEISQIDLETDQLNVRSKFLLMDTKKVGPDLKEVRTKLRPEWVPVWIKDPHAFRPTTRMPRFRLDDEEVKAVAAFIWQSGIDAKLPSQPRGDPVRGKESFETRGCMGCHSVGEGSNAVGGWFAANLTRVGEKANYDYLVRWIHNPRERTEPYCPYEKRDLTEADYKKHGLPFVFDSDHSKCPNDGHELQVEQMTVMPNLRLSWQEARDIASYLMTLKQQDPASYPKAAYLNDPALKARGKALVQFYGCTGCHEIARLEEEGRIGTELTKEGSKPLEQIDFALFIGDAKENDWYSHQGFFEHKLKNPGIFDKGMIKAEGEELKMPDFNWRNEEEEINGLTTFLTGSVSSQLPERYFYLPADYRKDIQEGWWLVKKYNCMGCHQFTLDQPSVLMTLPRYQTPDGKGQLPPRLLTEGARVNPEWLARFLANPALSERNLDQDGVRSYLKLRMPTFNFSPIEVRKLVRFFQALSKQPMPYIPPKIAPLTDQEIAMARALFTSRGAPCLKCHAIGESSHDKYASAPNFLLAPGRLKPDWVRHWILDPAKIDPGTAMPSGLFKSAEEHWVFAGPTPPVFKGYNGDHAELLVRYMFEMTPQEQRQLVGMSAGMMGKSTTENRAPSPTGTRKTSRTLAPLNPQGSGEGR